MRMRENRSKGFWLRGKVTAVAAVLLAALLTGCGSEGTSYDKAMMQETGQAAPAGNGMASDMYDGGYGMNEYADYEIEAQPQEPAVQNDSSSNVATSDRKLIRTVNMEVETKEYDAFLTALENEVQSRGGYIENMDSYNGSAYSGNRNNRRASLTIRIPKDKLDGFLDLVSDVGNVVRRFDNVEDVTLSYVDLESHRNALRTEQERLLELLEMAESIEDIITIEDRLSSVRYQLESMESQLRTMDNQVNYSTLTLDVSEVRELTPVVEQTVWERVAEGFSDSLEDIGDAAVEIMIWFLVNSPYLILFFLFLALVIIIIKLGWRSSMKKAEKQREEQKKEAQKREEQK